MEIDFKFGPTAILTTEAHRLGMKMHQQRGYPTSVSMLLSVIDRSVSDGERGKGNTYYCRIEHVGHDQSISNSTIQMYEHELTDDLSPVLPPEPEKKEPTQ